MRLEAENPIHEAFKEVLSCTAMVWPKVIPGFRGGRLFMKYDGLEVLLVEDDPDDLELTLQTLKDAHLTNPVQVVRDGVEPLDYIFCRGTHAGRKADGPSLILLDLKLPKIDGLQVLWAIKADHRTKGIPVVILTSFRAERDRIERLGLGASGYFQKPVDFPQLQKTVREMGYDLRVENQAMTARSCS
jgi:two-component system, response regulator